MSDEREPREQRKELRERIPGINILSEGTKYTRKYKVDKEKDLLLIGNCKVVAWASEHYCYLPLISPFQENIFIPVPSH